MTTVTQFLEEGHAKQVAADQAIMDLATGKTDNIHEVMLAVTKADLTFRTVLQVGGTFLYNVGPITSLNSSTWNRRQFYSVARVDWHALGGPRVTQLAENLSSPPCNIGPLSTPDYVGLANAAIHDLPGGGKVFAGQRDEVDIIDCPIAVSIDKVDQAAADTLDGRNSELHRPYFAVHWLGAERDRP